MHVVRKVEKKAGGILIGIVCRKYSILGRIFILMMAALPNQEKSPDAHLFKSLIMVCSSGKWFREYRSDREFGSCMPR